MADISDKPDWEQFIGYHGPDEPDSSRLTGAEVGYDILERIRKIKHHGLREGGYIPLKENINQYIIVWNDSNQRRNLNMIIYPTKDNIYFVDIEFDMIKEIGNYRHTNAYDFNEGKGWGAHRGIRWGIFDTNRALFINWRTDPFEVTK